MITRYLLLCGRRRSPSPRRAWIEIILVSVTLVGRPRRPPLGGRGLKWIIYYHLRAVIGRPPLGGRGLKFFWGRVECGPALASPSPRRAWIEIGSREQ